MEISAWMDLANCRGMGFSHGVNIFFAGAEDIGAEGNRMVRAAKEICAKCEVTSECLDYANTHHIKHGVWGGMSEKERRKRRRRRA